MLLKTWVLLLMRSLIPHTQWEDTFDQTAEAIAEVSEEHPVFAGARGPERTAALLVSLASFESAFRQDAMGDCGGKPASRAACASWGLYQINKHNFTIPGELALEDPYIATREAVRMIKLSQSVCRGRPVADMLAWYAAGGVGCDRALEKSHHRVWRAQQLVREHPFVPIEPVAAAARL